MKQVVFSLALLFAAVNAGTDQTLEPTPFVTRPPSPSDCVCEDLGFVAINGVCSRGCDIDEDAEFDSLVECCASEGFEGDSLPDCPVDDECGTPFPTPTPCVCEDLGYVVIDGACSRGCSLDEDGEFDSVEECCESIGFEDESLPECPVDDECGTPFPTRSPVTPFPTENTPAPTPADCTCEELGYVVIDGVCSRGCSLDEDGEFDDVFECCASIGFSGDEASGCPVDDDCGTPFPTPEPTPAPTECDCGELNFIVIDGVCSRGCSFGEGGEFDSVEECCSSIGFEGPLMLPDCPVFDECPVAPPPTPCKSTGKSGKSGAKSTSGDMSMDYIDYIDCFSSSKSGKGKGGKSHGYGGSSGYSDKGGKSHGYGGSSGYSDKGGKSHGGGYSDKGGKSHGYGGSSGYSDKGGKSHGGGYSDKGGKSHGYGGSSGYSDKGGKSHGGGYSDKGGKSHGYGGSSGYSDKGGKSHGGGYSDKGGKSDGYRTYESSFDGYGGYGSGKGGKRRLGQEAHANLRATANRN